MNKIPFLRFACFVLIILFSFVHFSFAEDPRFLSNYHVEYGLKLFNDKKFDLAVERFLKAFLLDPQNTLAKGNLQKIIQEQYVTNSLGLKILRFIDQIEYLDFLHMRYNDLTQENSRLLTTLRNQKNVIKEPEVFADFQVIETLIKNRSSIFPEVSLVGFERSDMSLVNLTGLTDQLLLERQKLSREVGFWEEQNEQLRELRRKVLSQNMSDPPALMTNKLKSQIEEFNQRISEKDQLLAVQEQNLEYFKNELNDVRNDFNELQEKFRLTESKISEFTNRIAAMSVELFEKNKFISEKESQAAKLENDLSVAYEKIILVQKIIQDKDDRIGALENEMAKVNQALSAHNGSFSSDNQVAELQTNLKDFESEFKSQIRKSRERMINLEVQYADLSFKYDALLVDLQTKDLQLAALKDAANKKELLANEYRTAFLITDEKANQLIGMVEIYREKLIETKSNLRSKQNELQQLQSVLFDLNPPPVSEWNKNSIPSINHEIYPNPDLTISKNRSVKFNP